MPFIKPILLIVFSTGAAFFLGHSFVPPAIEQPAAPAANEERYRGNPSAPLTLVVYVDYECPPCASYNPVLNEVLMHYGSKLRLEFRHFPMTTIHPNAVRAAIAVEAAGKQGHYWEMHDLLLSSQKQWARTDNPEEHFGKLATSLGLDTRRFLEALDSPALRERVTLDMTQGREMKIQAVPTFFLNARRIEPASVTAAAFFAIIDEELQTRK